MGLSNSIVKQFVEITNDTDKTKKEDTVYGTIVEYNDSIYAQIDGSTVLTPVSSTAKVKVGDRVIVRLKNHTATITGNLSDPSASSAEVTEMGGKVTNLEIVVADKVSVTELNAVKASIDTLTADNVEITGRLDAYDVDIENLEAKKAEIDDLKAAEAEIDTLQADYVNINQKLTAAEADVELLKADVAEIDVLKSDIAEIESLKADKAEIESLNTKYANIDFTNIGKAAMEYFYANSGLIENVVVGDQTITGKLVGVTISGDLIEGNTVKADKLVVKGEDGLYYKLNVTAGAVASEEVTEEQLQNGLHGSNIIASTITADKISVTDLVAFDATIAGFHIERDDDSIGKIYSDVKETADNTTRGIYMDTEGQFAVGDASNYLKFYKTSDGSYKLDISSESLQIALTNASKTATDFLDYDSTNGLQVGNKTGGSWKGFRTQMVSSAFNILSDIGEIVASYGANLIELGKNAASAIIKLCGGKGRIAYGIVDIYTGEVTPSENGTLTISSDHVEVGGKSAALRSRIYSIHDGEYGDADSILTGTASGVNVAGQSIEVWARTTASAVWDEESGDYVGTGESSFLNLTSYDLSGEVYRNIDLMTKTGDISLFTTVFGNVNINSAEDINLIAAGGVNINSRTLYKYGARVYGENSDGTTMLVFDPISNEGNTSIGYDHYTKSSGNTNIYGDKVQMFSRKGTQVFNNLMIAGVTKESWNDRVTGWYLGSDGTAHATHSSGASLSFHYGNSAATTTLIQETAPGTLSINGMPFGANKVLWSGGFYMTENHTVTLSESISSQVHGVVLVFSGYSNNEVKNFNFFTYVVPKGWVSKHGGAGHQMCSFHSTGENACCKYLYVGDTYIAGYKHNTYCGTGANGITYTNNAYVLRYVIGF